MLLSGISTSRHSNAATIRTTSGQYIDESRAGYQIVDGVCLGTWEAGAIEPVVIVMLPSGSKVCSTSVTSACVATATGLPASDDSEPEYLVPDTPFVVLDLAVGEFPLVGSPETIERLLAPRIMAGCATGPSAVLAVLNTVYVPPCRLCMQ